MRNTLQPLFQFIFWSIKPFNISLDRMLKHFFYPVISLTTSQMPVQRNKNYPVENIIEFHLI